MDQNKVKKRVVRVIGGLAFAIVFAIFAYVSCKVAVHSDECLTYEEYQYEDPNNQQIYTNKDYGYHRDEFLERQPQPKSGRKDASSEPEADTGASTPAPAAETPVPETPADEEPLSGPALKAKEKGLPTPPEIDINEWQYMLVNQDHILSADYAPESFGYLNMTASESDIQTEYNGQRCRVDMRIAEPLRDFAKGCADAGLPVFLSSGYRSYSEQQTNYTNKIAQYNADVARYIVAEPGTSEHQTGLCCDITDYYHQLKDSSLADTETFKWLNAHCAEYGFILRYPKDKSGDSNDLYACGDTITKVIYEPWHFRYVGKEAAQYIMENNLCLEEFWELYE